MSHFNEVANDWDSPFKTKMMETLAQKTREELKETGPMKDLRILDFGCGTGLFGLNFIESAKSLCGIDTSEGMLKVFDEKTKGHKEVSRELINLEEKTLDKEFDLIVSSMTFHHLNEPKNMIKKLKSMLSPGGRMAIVDLDKEDGSFHPNNETMGVKHFGFSNEELTSWAQEEGLSLQTTIINSIEKNDTSYGQFLAIFSL